MGDAKTKQCNLSATIPSARQKSGETIEWTQENTYFRAEHAESKAVVSSP